MTQIAGNSYTQLDYLNVIEELRVGGVLVTAQGSNVVQVFTADDLPDAVGGARALAPDCTYQIMALVEIGEYLVLPDGEHCEISSNVLNAGFSYTGTGGFIRSDTGIDGATDRITGLRIELNTAAATIFEIDGGFGGQIIVRDCVFIFNGVNLGLGNFSTVVLDLEDIFMFNPSLGSTLIDVSSIMVNVTVTAPFATAIGGALFSFTGVDNPQTIQRLGTNLQEDDTVFYFAPNMAGPIEITNVGDSEPTKVDLFLLEDDVQINLFTDLGGDVVRATTNAAHPYAVDDIVFIDNSIGYFGGHVITNVPDDMNFDFDFIFAISDVINVNNTFTTANRGSLNHYHPAMEVEHAHPTQSSQVIGSFVGSGGTASSTLSSSNYVAIDMDNMVGKSPATQRFLLVSISNGQCKYVGEDPISVLVRAIISGGSDAGNDTCGLRLVQNGMTLTPIVDAVDWTSLFIPGGGQTVVVGQWMVSLEPADTLQLLIANLTDDSDFVVTAFSLQIEG